MPRNAIYGPHMQALIETAIARGWVDWRATHGQLWRRVSIETDTLYDNISGVERSAQHALQVIRSVDLLMLGLA